MPIALNTCSSREKPVPQFEALKRAEDMLQQKPCPRLQTYQCVIQRVFENAQRNSRFQSIPEFTRSLPKIFEFDVTRYLTMKDTEGPFEVHGCGYPSNECKTVRDADARAQQYAIPLEFAEVFNAKKEVIASYFNPQEPFLTFVVEGYDSSADAGMDWFVHMRLALASLESAVQAFETEADVYRYAEKVLPASNAFTGEQALVVAKLDLDEFGRLLKYPDATVVLVYQYGDVFECHDSVPESFKLAHPVCRY